MKKNSILSPRQFQIRYKTQCRQGWHKEDLVKRLCLLGTYEQQLIVDGFMHGNSCGDFYSVQKRDICGTRLPGRKQSGTWPSWHVIL